MNWAVWLILLIPVAVSILSLLFKNKEEPKRDGRLPPPAGRPGAQRPGRRAVSDIDQFLEEINRRRREAAERRRVPEAGAVPTPTQLPPPPPPPPPPIAERPVSQAPRPRSLPPPPVRQPSRRPERERPAPPRLRERLPQAEAVIVAEAVAPPVRELPPSLQQPQEAPAPAVVAPRRPTSPALAQLMTMLRSPQSLQAVILLREVLDPPLSVTRRGGQSGLFRRTS